MGCLYLSICLSPFQMLRISNAYKININERNKNESTNLISCRCLLQSHMSPDGLMKTNCRKKFPGSLQRRSPPQVCGLATGTITPIIHIFFLLNFLVWKCTHFRKALQTSCLGETKTVFPLGSLCADSKHFMHIYSIETLSVIKCISRGWGDHFPRLHLLLSPNKSQFVEVSLRFWS